MGYAIAPLRWNGVTHVVVATESKGPCLIFSPPEWKMRVLADGPGGSMSLMGVPAREEALIAIMECYPVFRFEHGGIYLYRPAEEAPAEEQRPASRGSSQQGGKPMWKGKRLFDLPFAHRLEIVNVGGEPYLIAATISAGKSHKDDWSQPGTVYAMAIPDDLDSQWKPTPILRGIVKNHGLHRTIIDNQEMLLVSGQQGLFAVKVPKAEGGEWESEKLIAREISEVYAADLDGDGHAELVTIEPFHGNTLSVYKRSGDRLDSTWHRLFEADLDFGHGVWAGTLAGEPAVIAGSRSGNRDLSVFTIQSLVPFVGQRSVIEQDAGPTQFLVLHEEGADLVFSVNQAQSEIALYTVTP